MSVPPEKFYTDIPPIRNEYSDYPAKIFVIDESLLDEFLLRAIFDDSDQRLGYVHAFDGPSLSNEFVVTLQPSQMISYFKKQPKLPMLINSSASCNGLFNAGAIDIVTYPFYFALIHDIALADGRSTSNLVQKINNNLINHYIAPEALRYGTISIFHFNERPIDDNPVHNILLWGNIHETPSPTKIAYEQHRDRIPSLINQSPLNKSFVAKGNSVMDDRYVYSTRRPEDGPPFDLSIITQAIRRLNY